MTAVEEQFDVVVLGATPGGIAAALAAGRLGRRVLLVEYHRHVGGMSASGLGKSDVEKRHLIGGLFDEFTAWVRDHYRRQFGEGSPDFELCQDGYYFEPSVAENVFEAMLADCVAVSVRKNCRLESAQLDGGAVKRVVIVDRGNGESHRVAAGVFVDATYEGDLLAAAGAGFRLGRESREEFDEAHAGRIFFDYQQGEILDGSTGEGDDALPAYTYRLCLSTDAENSVPLAEPPSNYDRKNYLAYFDDLNAGRLDAPRHFKPGRGYEPAHFGTMVRALSVTPLPNGKTDVNINPRPLGFPFAGENAGYVAGSDDTRHRVSERIRELTLGLLYFLQNDPDVPADHRQIANGYHPAADEFADNDHFPFQLYVREARRLIGEYTLTENDVTGRNGRGGPHADTVAIGEFPIDSFPCHKRGVDDPTDVVLEGYLGMVDSITRPYEIPYRIMIPERVDGLIVPVAASTTHVAYSSIRMEPTWMALGQAAGTAAHLALLEQVPLRAVPLDTLRSRLAQDGQVLEKDCAADSSASAESLNLNPK